MDTVESAGEHTFTVQYEDNETEDIDLVHLEVINNGEGQRTMWMLQKHNGVAIKQPQPTWPTCQQCMGKHPTCPTTIFGASGTHAGLCSNLETIVFWMSTSTPQHTLVASQVVATVARHALPK